jgi:hypothetical protein
VKGSVLEHGQLTSLPRASLPAPVRFQGCLAHQS